MQTNSTYSRGFTLIELSIVLVIIGLLVGGILVGQNMIENSTLNATITQIQKYQTAVQAFRTKYGGLPGDLSATKAASFGFPAGAGTAGLGDGDNFIATGGGGTYGGGHLIGYGETAVFWTDLSLANLIDGSYTAGSMTPGPDVSGTAIAQYLPPAKLGQNNYVYIWAASKSNPPYGYALTGPDYYGISQVSQILNASSGGRITSTPGILVRQAYYMDKKVDDGLPLTGRVVSLGVFSDPGWSDGTNYLYNPPPSSAVAGSASTCFDNNNGALPQMQYSMPTNKGAAMKCMLSIQFQ